MAQTTARRWTVLAILAVLAAVPAAVGIHYLIAYLHPAADGDYTQQPSDRPMMNTPFIQAGIAMPPATPAYEANLADDADVIGVEVRGKHRAYYVGIMKQIRFHVINDLIDSVPVSVTYCPERKEAQVFTSEKRGEPLSIALGGWHNGTMLLKNGNAFFHQDTGAYSSANFGDGLPFPIMAHQRKNWKTWREAHPDTDVFVQPRS